MQISGALNFVALPKSLQNNGETRQGSVLAEEKPATGFLNQI